MPLTNIITNYATQGDLTLLTASTPKFVNATRMTIDTLMATYPAGVAYRGMYAPVSDLFGALDAVLRCGFDGTRYFWQPSGLPEYIASMAVSSNVTLTALKDPTIIPLSGTIGVGVTRQITLDTNNVWPGARKRISTNGISSLLGTLQLLNGVSALVNLAIGSTYDVAVDFSGGTAQWVRV